MIEALLLLGPTGAGKSPLGDELERRGLRGRRCLHFDFGARLRAVAAGEAGRTGPNGFAQEAPEFQGFPPDRGGKRVNRSPAETVGPAALELTGTERAVVRRVLATGALLEDGEFPIALKILASFLRQRSARPGDIVILNGLPRHAGQAERLEAIIDVRTVVSLECPGPVALARIRGNTGGDRSGRSDDEAAEIDRRLAVYEARTLPLLDFYASREAEVIRLPVYPGTTAAELAARLESTLAGRNS